MNIETPIKLKFSSTEDQIILNLVNIYGTHNWNEVAKHLLNRTPKQCRNRFQTYLSPPKNRHPWSKEEDEKLISLVQQNGLLWNDFQQYFPQRTAANLRNRWYVHLSRKRSDKIASFDMIGAAEKLDNQFQNQHSSQEFLPEIIFESICVEMKKYFVNKSEIIERSCFSSQRN
jgi:hypothetical protein